MMEKVRQRKSSRSATVPSVWPLNDNWIPPLSMGRSVFPEDAVARIYKPSHSVMTSGKAHTKAGSSVMSRAAPCSSSR